MTTQKSARLDYVRVKGDERNKKVTTHKKVRRLDYVRVKGDERNNERVDSNCWRPV